MPGFLHNTCAVMRRETGRITRQPMYFVLMIVLPVVSFAFFALLFNQGAIRNIPIAVLDQDNTTLSRKAVQMIDDTPTAMVAYGIQGMDEGERLMREGRIMAIVQIPAFFEKNILSNSQTLLENYVSGTNITVNGLLSKDIQTAVTTFTAGIQLQVLMKQGLTQRQAMAQLMPVRFDKHVLFNPHINYGYYLSPSFMPMMLMIFVVMVTVFAIGTELKHATAREWLGTGNGSVAAALAGKVLPITAPMFLKKIQDLSAAGKIGCLQRVGDRMIGIAHERDGRFTDLAQIEGTDIARHADGNTHIVVDENGRKAYRQQRRLFRGSVIVIDEIHRFLVDVAEKLRRDRLELCFRIARCGIFHFAGIGAAEVALGVHKRMQKRLIAAGQTHHRLIDRRIAVRVELHGRAHDVRGFHPLCTEQIHLVHRIQELAVRGLETVDLRNGARHDNAHRIGHIVGAQRVGDRLRLDLTGARDVGVVRQFIHRLNGSCFFCHRFFSPHQLRSTISRYSAPCAAIYCRCSTSLSRICCTA